jgi:hypothetical protein
MVPQRERTALFNTTQKQQIEYWTKVKVPTLTNRGWGTRATSFVRSAAKQVDDQGDHGEKQKQMDEKTRDVVDEESAGPKQK